MEFDLKDDEENEEEDEIINNTSKDWSANC